VQGGGKFEFIRVRPGPSAGQILCQAANCLTYNFDGKKFIISKNHTPDADFFTCMYSDLIQTCKYEITRISDMLFAHICTQTVLRI
jgi:hypothetical protein